MTDTKQALEAVVGLDAWKDFGGPMVWHDIEDDGWTLEQRKVMAASVNLIRTHGPALLAALDQVAQLQAALGEAERDAGRYRWLRGVSGPAVIHWYDKSADDGLALGALDRAIDDAMAAGGGE